jgi:DNA-binding transcriptional LysR family regulator
MCYMINLHRLEGLFWVAKTGGYARAARAFPYPITQPAVHQQVKKLEKELGTPLFERVGKDRMRPTPAGAYLYEFVAPFFTGLPYVVRALQTSDYAGELHIRAASLLLRDLLPAWIARLRRKCPDARIHLHEMLESGLPALLAGEVDLLVTHIPDVPAEVETLQIGTLHGFVVVPQGHRLSKRKQVALREIAGEPFISYTPGIQAHEIQMQGLAAAGVEPSSTVTAHTVQTILAYVKAGLGVSAVATLDATGPHRRGVVALRVVDPKVQLPLVAAWRRNGPPHPLLEAAIATAPRP